MTLLGFPLDSEQLGFHDDGYPRYSHEYDSADYRSLLTALVSDGIIAGYGDDFKVTFSDSAQKTNATAVLNIAKGASVFKGCFGIETDGESIVVNAPMVDGAIGAQSTTHTLIGLRFKTRELTNLASEDALYFSDTGSDGDPAFRDNALYLARVVSKTTKETGGAYSYQHTIEDLRASEHCGWSAPFVELDTSAYYDDVQQLVNELEEQTQVAVDLAQSAIDGTLAVELDSKIDSLTSELDSKIDDVEGELDSRIDAIESTAPALLERIETLNGTDLNYLFTPGSYYIDGGVIDTIEGRPEDAGSNSARLYVSYVGGESYDLYDVLLQTYVTRTDNIPKTFCRIIVGRATTLQMSYPWIRVLSGQIATQDIEDGSVTEDKLADELKGSFTKQSGQLAAGLKFAISGNICQLSYSSGSTKIAKGETLLANLPSNMLPKIDSWNDCSVATSESPNLRFTVASAGYVKIYNYSTKDYDGVTASITYVLNSEQTS